MRRAAVVIAGLSLLTACGARSSLPEGPPRGDGGGSSSSSGAGGGCMSDPMIPKALHGRVRDFSVTHPDFEHFLGGGDKGIVRDTLGADGAPVFNEDQVHPTTTGKAEFDQWYHDTPGVNLGKDMTLTFATSADGSLLIANNNFFPIDGQLLGNEGLPHNFAFTVEQHTTFRVKGGEFFDFTGDDDIFVFINGHLAVDLGGVHPSENGSIDLDTLGLPHGEIVPLDIFSAERHTSGSVYHVHLSGFDLCE